MKECTASFSETSEKEAFKIPDFPFDKILKEDDRNIIRGLILNYKESEN